MIKEDDFIARQSISTVCFSTCVFTLSQSVFEVPFAFGMASSIALTRVASHLISIAYIDFTPSHSIYSYIVVDVTAATAVATITTVALTALAGIPIFSLATANLIFVTVVPVIIDTLLSARYFSNLNEGKNHWSFT